MPEGAVLLFEDETLLRLFPVLRRAWGFRGEEVSIGISGRNAKRVLFGAINPRTGHRVLQRSDNMSEAGGVSRFSTPPAPSLSKTAHLDTLR
jgi:hypothetical protein